MLKGFTIVISKREGRYVFPAHYAQLLLVLKHYTYNVQQAFKCDPELIG